VTRSPADTSETTVSIKWAMPRPPSTVSATLYLPSSPPLLLQRQPFSSLIPLSSSRGLTSIFARCSGRPLGRRACWPAHITAQCTVAIADSPGLPCPVSLAHRAALGTERRRLRNRSVSLSLSLQASFDFSMFPTRRRTTNEISRQVMSTGGDASALCSVCVCRYVLVPLAVL
jgi:hypothetical protein